MQSQSAAAAAAGLAVVDNLSLVPDGGGGGDVLVAGTNVSSSPLPINRRDLRLRVSRFWPISEVSAAPGTQWLNNPVYKSVGSRYNSYGDSSGGEGQYLYCLDEWVDGSLEAHYH